MSEFNDFIKALEKDLTIIAYQADKENFGGRYEQGRADGTKEMLEAFEDCLYQLEQILNAKTGSFSYE